MMIIIMIEERCITYKTKQTLENSLQTFHSNANNCVALSHIRLRMHLSVDDGGNMDKKVHYWKR